MSRYHCGPLEIRPNEGRTYIEGHMHKKDHVTFARRGIVLLQQLRPDTFEVVRQLQLVSEEFKETDRMMRLYEPERVRVPYRAHGTRPKSPWGEVILVPPDQAPPLGATPIPIVATKYWALIKAGVCHSLFRLTEGAAWDCAFGHYSEDGEPAQEFTGWEGAYD